VEIISWLVSNLLTVILGIMIPIAFAIGNKRGFRRCMKSGKLSMHLDNLSFEQLIHSSEKTMGLVFRKLEAKLQNNKYTGQAKQTLSELRLISSDMLVVFGSAHMSNEPCETLNFKNTRLRDLLDHAHRLRLKFEARMEEAKRAAAEVERLGVARNGQYVPRDPQGRRNLVQAPQGITPPQNGGYGYPQGRHTSARPTQAPQETMQAQSSSYGYSQGHPSVRPTQAPQGNMTQAIGHPMERRIQARPAQQPQSPYGPNGNPYGRRGNQQGYNAS
jgi:hypothetical protein